MFKCCILKDNSYISIKLDLEIKTKCACFFSVYHVIQKGNTKSTMKLIHRTTLLIMGWLG